MKHILLVGLLIGSAIAVSQPIQAQSVFKCPDANGRIQYTDKPCGGSLQSNRVRVQENALDASHARGQVRRMQQQEEQANDQRYLNQQVQQLQQQGSNRDSAECKMAVRNANTQSMNASPAKIDSDRAAARLICDFDPWPGPSMAEIDAQNRRTQELERQRRKDENPVGTIASCDSAGCWDTNGNRLNNVAGGNFVRSDGKFCTRAGTSVVCN